MSKATAVPPMVSVNCGYRTDSAGSDEVRVSPPQLVTSSISRIGLFLVIAVLGAVGARSSTDQALGRFEYTEIHMGVETRIVLFATDDIAARRAARAAFDRIVGLDAVMSDYRSDSELMRVCASGSTGRRPVSPDLHRVLVRAGEIAEATDGAFDVTVGPLVRLWRQARREHRLPDAEAIAWAMDYKRRACAFGSIRC